MVSAQQQRFTASELVLLAAEDLVSAGNEEFSEWDLTVASWARDRFRFGLRGYAQSYPDHKRVMMEIMGQKASSPIQQKFMEKVRPNYYRLTPLGRDTAARLKGGTVVPPRTIVKPVTAKELYETALAYTSRPEFSRWRDNPEEPREWDDARNFLSLGKEFQDRSPVERLEEIRSATQNALDWCNHEGAMFLTRGSGQGGAPIHLRDLSDLLDFLTALTYRFPDHLDQVNAITVTKRFD